MELVLPERKVIIGADGKIERIVTRQTLEAHRLILRRAGVPDE